MEDKIASAGRQALMDALDDLVQGAIDKFVADRALADPLEISPQDRIAIEDGVIREWLGKYRPEKIHSKYDTISIGKVRIDWPNRLPGLKTWAGGQKLDGIFWGLVDALPDVGALLDARGVVNSVSGMSAGQKKVNALDLGFSPNADMRYETNVGADLFRFFAFALLPVTSYPDGRYKVAGEYIKRVPRGLDSYYGALVPASAIGDQ